MLNINGIKVSEYLADLWERERQANWEKYQDENNELDTNDDIGLMEVWEVYGEKTLNLYHNGGRIIRKAVPDEIIEILEKTSIKSISLNRKGFSLATDLYNVYYDYDGHIEGVEEL